MVARPKAGAAPQGVAFGQFEVGSRHFGDPFLVSRWGISRTLPYGCEVEA